jgi:hypothetical protein
MGLIHEDGTLFLEWGLLRIFSPRQKRKKGRPFPRQHNPQVLIPPAAKELFGLRKNFKTRYEGKIKRPTSPFSV